METECNFFSFFTGRKKSLRRWRDGDWLVEMEVREREVCVCVLQLHRMEVLFDTRGSRVTADGHGNTVCVSRRLAFIGRRVVAGGGLSVLHVAGTAAVKACRVVELLLLLLLLELLLLVLVLGCGRRRRQGRWSGRVWGVRERAGEPYGRGVGGEVVLEDRKVRHGRVHHLRKVVVGELGCDEVAAPEVVLAPAAALVHLLLNVAHGAVHGERHAVARDDGVVDNVGVRELLIHHV